MPGNRSRAPANRRKKRRAASVGAAAALAVCAAAVFFLREARIWTSAWIWRTI